MGTDIPRLFTIVFGIGAALCAVAGALLGPLLAVQVGMGENILILAFVVIVIGGIGSIRGALVGAILVGCDRHARPHAAAARAARVPAAAVGERRRAGDRLDRGLRVHGDRAGDQAAGPLSGARLMAPARPEGEQTRRPGRQLAALAALDRRRASPCRWLLRALGLDFYLSLASRIVVYAIAATSLNLVLGYAGLVSFGHAAFFGLGAYVTAIMISEGVQSGVAPSRRDHRGRRRSPRSSIGAISLRTRGVYFIMITLAFAQMLYYLANSVKGYGGDEGLTIRARSLFALGGRVLDLKDPLALYYVALAVLALALRRARPLRALALRPRRARAARRRRSRRGARLSDLPLQARRLRRRRRARRRRRRAERQPAGLRQPERAALDAVGHADGDGHPRRRRHGLGRRRRRRGAAAAAGGARVVHRAPRVLDRLGAARGRAVRAPGPGRPVDARAARRAVDERRSDTRARRCSTVRGLEKRFGGVVATDRVDLDVERRRDPRADRPERRRQDDAGRASSAASWRATAGTIVFDGADITPLAAHQRARRGLARSFQITRLFRSASVLDNVALAVQAVSRHAACAPGGRLARDDGALRARAPSCSTTSASAPRQPRRSTSSRTASGARSRSAMTLASAAAA